MARKILLADDSVTAQNMGRKILTDAGYEVITVNNGSSALKKITELKPDLIVLDVYMPGYSGLEVCQRIKEADDTARIPVLLTVGKLEPFKQEEARRARADAFIIKPFEATELLAAVGKLQDKLEVVPSPAPAAPKEARVPKTSMASFERAMSESTPKFGDEDSGWKARLTIPAPGSKLKPEHTEPEPSATHLRDGVDARQPAASFERPIPAGIPRDITADEIAAITAAAARVNVGLNVGKEFERYKQESSSRPEFATVSAESREEAKSHVADTAAEKVPQAATVSERAVPSPQGEPSTHSEVAAATSVPAPAEAPAKVVALSAPAEAPTLAPKPMAAVAGAEPVTMAASPRWVAEEVTVEAHESTLVLEREMHKAFAAFAAAEYAAMPPEERGAIDKNDEPFFATMAPPAIGTPVPVAEESKSKPEEKTAEVAASPSAATTEPARVQDLPKPPAPSFAPAGPAPDEPRHAVVAFGAPTPFGEAEAPAANESYPSDLQTPAPVIAAETPTKMAEETQEVSKAAAANKDSAAPDPDRNQKPEIEPAKLVDPEPAVREAAMAAAASADGSSSDLSSIVDNMLAELKPKLMAELAKKLEKKK